MLVSMTDPHTWVVVRWCLHGHGQTAHQVMEKARKWAGMSSYFGLLTLGFIRCQMSVCIPSHTSLSVTSRIDALAPGCDRLCMAENNVVRNVSDKKGRTSPVLVSHTTSKYLRNRYPRQFQRCRVVLKKLLQQRFFLYSSTKCWYSTHVRLRFS